MPKSIIELTILDLGSKGEGIAKHEGLTVFVNGAIPGDHIRAQILSTKKNYATARITKLITPSPDRIAPPCDHARQCGGCQIQDMNYAAQLAYKQTLVINCLERIGKVPHPPVNPVLGMARPFDYRNKVIFPCGTGPTGPVLGFYKINSHDLVPITHCRTQPPGIAHLVSLIRLFIAESGISIYEENTHQGLLRHLLIRQGINTDQIMVCLVINGETIPQPQALIDRLGSIPQLRSICLNTNTRPGNTILGATTTVLWGNDHITETLGPITYTISPLSFFQINTAQAEILYRTIAELAELDGRQTVVDLYCGTGSIALYLAHKTHRVIGIEILPDAIRDAQNNARLNQIDNVEFFCGKAETLLPQLTGTTLSGADVVIVDPPRKGCEVSLVDTIGKLNPAKIIYVSCDPATLARDIQRLGQFGYQLRAVQPVDMFPHTVHIENVALLTKASEHPS